jgi:hypothetical protein
MRPLLPDVPMNLTHTKLVDVEAAFLALPRKGRVEYVRGHVAADGGFSHVQGLAVANGHYLFAHSDENREGGRILIADRARQELTAWFAIPPFTIPPAKPFFHHAGGCQLLGDVLVVACETGQADPARSVVAFFDVADAAFPKEIASLRIENRSSRAMAAGITTITNDGVDTCLVATFEHGHVAFYEFEPSSRPPRRPTLEVDVKEDGHQAFLLLTDRQNRVFAVGLSSGGLLGKAEAILYRLVRGATAQDANALNPIARSTFDTDEGARLRWGATIDVPSEDRMVLYCSSRRFDRGDFDDSVSGESGCTLNIFDPGLIRRARATNRAAATRRSAKGASRRPAPAARDPRRPRSASAAQGRRPSRKR